MQVLQAKLAKLTAGLAKLLTGKRYGRPLRCSGKGGNPDHSETPLDKTY